MPSFGSITGIAGPSNLAKPTMADFTLESLGLRSALCGVDLRAVVTRLVSLREAQRATPLLHMVCLKEVSELIREAVDQEIMRFVLGFLFLSFRNFSLSRMMLSFDGNVKQKHIRASTGRVPLENFLSNISLQRMI